MYDIAVIGSGPGGYVAAIRAAQLGNKVLLVEKSKLGGVCLNQGCIPTKVLLNSGEMFHKTRNLENYGIEISKASFNIHTVVKRARNISEKLVQGITTLVKKNKIDLIYGVCSFKDKNTLIIVRDNNVQKIKTKNVIIATGARPKSLKGIKIDHVNIWDYTDALFPTKIPKSMIIIGSGAIGMEFASFYNQIGSEVTVLEAKEDILPSEDEEIVKIAKSSFQKRGIKFFTGIRIEKVLIKDKAFIEAEFLCNNDQKHILISEILLCAAGVEANVEELNLNNISLKTDNNLINIKENMETEVEGVFAIGDVTNKVPWLAHKASHEAIIAAEAISKQKFHKMNYNNIPICIYSSPEIASIGLTEKEALRQGYKVSVGRFPFYGNGKALIIGDSEGMIKTIFDKNTGELLGAHMVGSHVTELIHSYSIAKSSELTDEELINGIFPHPTLSEMIHESSLNALKKSIHI